MRHTTHRRKFLKQLTAFTIVPSLLFGNSFSHKNKIHRIGFFSGASVGQLEKAFTEELRKLGFKEGENVHVEMRLARPNTTEIVTMAVELAKMDLSLIVAGALPFAIE